MDQLRTAFDGPHGYATTITWVVAGAATLVALVHALRRGPDDDRWSRLAAVAFPAAVAWTLLAGWVAGSLRGPPLQVAMFLRMLGFWVMVLTAPFAVGQVVRLRPPRWLARTHLTLGGGFLLLLATSDLAFRRNVVLDPPTQFGPLAVAFLVPVAAFAGWWLLSCLGRIEQRASLVLFALGGSITTLALIVAALVIDPVLADHLLVVAFLPVLAAAQVVEVQRAWSERRLRAPSRSPAGTRQ